MSAKKDPTPGEWSDGDVLLLMHAAMAAEAQTNSFRRALARWHRAMTNGPVSNQRAARSELRGAAIEVCKRACRLEREAAKQPA